VSERVADEGEMSSNLQALAVGIRQAAAQQLLRPQTHPDFNGRDCVDCGTPLPGIRLAHKWVRCAPHQAELEARLKRQGRL